MKPQTIVPQEWVGATILWRQVIRKPFLFGLLSRRVLHSSVNQSTILAVTSTALRIKTPTIFGPGFQWISIDEIKIIEAFPDAPEEPSWT